VHGLGPYCYRPMHGHAPPGLLARARRLLLYMYSRVHVNENHCEIIIRFHRMHKLLVAVHGVFFSCILLGPICMI
jgi:hypothetical protein